MAERLSTHMDRQQAADVERKNADLRTLTSEIAAVAARITAAERAGPSLASAVTAAQETLRELRIQHGIGRATDNEVTAARQALESATAARDASRDDLAALQAGKTRLEAEVEPVRKAAADARMKFRDTMVASIRGAIANDKRLREQFEMLYAAMHSAWDPGVDLRTYVDWGETLLEIFPDWDADAHAAIMARFARDLPPLYEAPAA